MTSRLVVGARVAYMVLAWLYVGAILAQVARVRQALDYYGSPLPREASASLERLAPSQGDEAVTKAVQEALTRIDKALAKAERKALQVLIDHTQQSVNGWVRVKLYKGSVSVVSRDSKTDSLFDPTIATFEDDAGAYNQKDAEGFIKLNALRMRIAANKASSSAPKRAAAKKPGAKKPSR